MRHFSTIIPIAIAGLLMAGPGFAHTAAAPVTRYTTSARHSQHGQPNSHHTGDGFLNGIVRAIFGADVNTAPNNPIIMYAELVPAQEAAVRSDDQRFEAATGRPLPLSHGVIVLPPSHNGGDDTYIWPSTGRF
jgi:hypothetical protein